MASTLILAALIAALILALVALFRTDGREPGWWAVLLLAAVALFSRLNG